jgi:YidC/Oxa1 family membrane protein insertase
MNTEKRLLLAVVLMMAAVVLVNIIFPPGPPQPREGATDTLEVPAPSPRGAADTSTGAMSPDTVPGSRAAAGRLVPPPDSLPVPAPAEPESVLVEDTIWVTSPLYRLGFADRGGHLVSAEMLRFESLAPESRGQPVQLVPAGAENFLSHLWVVGGDTLDLGDARFDILPPQLSLPEGSPPQTLTLTYQHPRADLRVELTYTFKPDSYVVELQGQLRGVQGTGWWGLGLGPGLVSNEWDPEQDYKSNLQFSARGPQGVQYQKVSDVAPGERIILDGPFEWAAVRTKYFVAALVRPPEAPEAARLAGLRIEGLPASPYRARAVASFPLQSGGSFRYRFYIGPQDYTRLSHVGHELDEVNPYGYKWLQPVLRPLAGAITTLLVWMHNAFALGYGWILIIFGIGIRVVLFPLYQKSMRSQMATMRVQPLMKEIQTKYKNDPQKLQQEMLKLYKEHGVNPLGGCLPMLLPFPILIALFFVFRDTIEFRGVPFLWLPDLSRPDPYYIIPVLMGISVFVLQWITQRTTPQSNPQMKMMMWIMPVMLTVLFLNFASGLNLYYATMNLASLPQQLYLAKERRAAAPPQPSKS